MAVVTLGAIEPADAVAAFRARGQLQPSFRWQEVWQEEHARAFAVAGVSRLDVLQLFHDEVQRAVAAGGHLQDVKRQLIPALQAKGFWGDVEVTDPRTGERRKTRFDDRRLELIFDVNLRQSHAAGRWARIERNKARLPLVMYRTMQDEKVRASHRAWDGVALPVEHPFWRTHYPPNGWRCRCIAYGVSERDLARLRAAGKTVTTEAPDVDWMPWVNPATGELAPVPRGIDPGFAYNPGQQRDAAFFDAALAKAARAHPVAGAIVVAQAQIDLPGMVTAKTEEFARWVTAVRRSGQVSGEVHYVGVLPRPALRGLREAGIDPVSAVLAVRDTDVLHALRDAKGASAVEESLYARLPELLQRASALLLDRATQPPALLYVVDLLRDDGRVAKVVVQIDQAVKVRNAGRRMVPKLNIVRTVTLLDANALQDTTRYRRLWWLPQ
ncbi:MAG TPA: phage minor head protein [Rubrivivax sp.]|jgi:SPP1 gp7 family putative phage head morphogenesis protein|nr:phage minor head protein [Rubrivivax sp.]